MLTTLDDVRFAVIVPATARLLAVLEQLSRTSPSVPMPLVITAGSNGSHMAHSRHYSGEAVDIRTHNFRGPDAKHAFQRELAAALGAQFTVLLEDEGLSNEHLHAQVRKDHAFDPTQE